MNILQIPLNPCFGDFEDCPCTLICSMFPW